MVINYTYGGFWNFRFKKHQKITTSGFWRKIYYRYQRRFGCQIGEGANFGSTPILPHDLYGIFISTSARIGKNVVIFQHVTIGSNTLEDHPRKGAPTIGDNVYIGAGAKIIGKVTIGDNCRIGANAVVVKDMPPNTTAVGAATRFITLETKKDNKFIAARDAL